MATSCVPVGSFTQSLCTLVSTSRKWRHAQSLLHGIVPTMKGVHVHKALQAHRKHYRSLSSAPSPPRPSWKLASGEAKQLVPSPSVLGDRAVVLRVEFIQSHRSLPAGVLWPPELGISPVPLVRLTAPAVFLAL